MLYKPNKKETQQMKKLNKGFSLINDGLKLIMENAPKNDGDISVFAYRVKKNIDKIVKRTAELLKAQYMTEEFYDIVKNMKIKKDKTDR